MGFLAPNPGPAITNVDIWTWTGSPAPNRGPAITNVGIWNVNQRMDVFSDSEINFEEKKSIH